MKLIEIRPNGTKRVYTRNDLPSMADQSAAEECDVNNIIAKFTKTRQITHLNTRQGAFADVSAFSDLLSATIQVKEANEKFMLLPSELREKLNNNPQNLLSYLEDPRNDNEAVRYGLKTKSPGMSSEGNHPETSSKSALEKNSKTKKALKPTANDELNDE